MVPPISHLPVSHPVGINRVSAGKRSSSSGPSQASQRVYRLVDQQGLPHPVLDDLYDSLDTAWAEAQAWWSHEWGVTSGPVGIGVEVSTSSGSWRTLRHPGS